MRGCSPFPLRVLSSISCETESPDALGTGLDSIHACKTACAALSPLRSHAVHSATRFRNLKCQFQSSPLPSIRGMNNSRTEELARKRNTAGDLSAVGGGESAALGDWILR